MFLAMAVETNRDPQQRQNYKIWYLEISASGDVQSIGVKTKEELMQSLFENYRQFGNTNWRCFLKGEERSTPIEIFDFIAMNTFDNTHFGNLPTLNEFQKTIDSLTANFELRSIA